MAPKWNWNQKHIWDKKAQFTIMHRKHRFCICRSRDIKRDAWHWTRLGSIGSITRLIKWRNSFCTLRPPCMNEGKWSLKVVPNVTLDIFRNSKWKRFFFSSEWSQWCHSLTTQSQSHPISASRTAARLPLCFNNNAQNCCFAFASVCNGNVTTVNCLGKTQMPKSAQAVKT